MKRSILPLVFMLAVDVGWESVAFSDPATAAGASRERPGAQAVYEHSAGHRVNAFAKNYHTNAKK
ncbi:MAG TPA: hypothetical protein VMT22_00105, partial [Terriglobales bacterium]|nr:hypothetical protein [Terriglobales bacterium]